MSSMKSYVAFVADNTSHNIDELSSIHCDWREQTIPDIKENEVQISVHYSSLNYKDALAITGKGKILRELPLVPGIDAAGRVLRSRSTAFREGDAVVVTGCGLGETKNGGLSQVITVPESWVIALPATLSLETAALLGTAGFTAALALHQLEKNDLKHSSDKPVLITGATGGVGSLSLLLLRQHQYKTCAWSRKDTHTSFLKKCGADQIKTPPIENARPLESSQFAAAIDNVGGQVLANLIPHIQPHGSVACVGLAQSAELQTTVYPLILRGVNLLGISSATCPRPLRELLWQKLAATPAPWLTAKSQDLGRSQVFSYAQKMIEGNTLGRCLVHLQKEVI